MDISKYVNSTIQVYNVNKTGDGSIKKSGQKTIKARINSESTKYLDKDGEVKYSIGTIRTLEEINTNMYVNSNNTIYRIVTAMPIYELDGVSINHYRGVLADGQD